MLRESTALPRNGVHSSYRKPERRAQLPELGSRPRRVPVEQPLQQVGPVL
ncbi:MAG TPA: hypothetical protein VKV35_10680 [Streptosporangiaceae bacterium]|nr:hypothetical protein [Streptosporangiaceae bacterium]